MKLRIAAWIVAALMLAATYPAWSQGFGDMGRHFGRMGVNGKTHAVVASSCVSPTAPNGVVDLSLCSNSYYVALIF